VSTTDGLPTRRNALEASILGYLSAVAGSTLAIFAILFARIPPDPFVPFRPDLLATSVGLFVLVALIVFVTALFPFAIIVTLGERCRIDSVVYYVGCGAVTGAAVITGFIARDAQSIPYLSQHWTDLLGTESYFVISGAIGGLMHWCVCGRHAGARPT
jgi:hypothetical protein